MAAPSWNGEILPDSRSYSNMRRKLIQEIQNSKPDNVCVRPLKCTTSITYQAMVIFIITMGLFGKATSFELHTERFVKVVRGRNASLICSFTDPADAVYWYKHNSTGAPDDDAELVARKFLGRSDPLPGIERFRITKDYRLLISEVSIADETTYSCFVVPQAGLPKRGYTDLRVIVLADSDGPKIGSCNTIVPGECTYNVPTDPPEEVVFVCELCSVRPSVNLAWVRSDDRVMEQALGPLIVEKDGLYDVVSILKVPKSGFEYHYLCQATGDAVQNASSTKVTFEEGTVLVSGWSDTSVLGVVVGLVVVIGIAVVLSLWMFLRGKHAQARAKATKRNRLTLDMVKTDPESSLPDKQDGEQDNLKSLQGENVENEHEEERAKFEQEEKQSLESILKEYELNKKELERVISKQKSRIGEYEKNEIQLNMLKRKVEELEQERERDKAKFEEQQLVELKLTRENQTLKEIREARFQMQSFPENEFEYVWNRPIAEDEVAKRPSIQGEPAVRRKVKAADQSKSVSGKRIGTEDRIRRKK
ncbi:uncharacterized protein LOC129267275 isoform X1 [Lytechinus pictus]|uniref:uncharacterized protein LOC129267275 isoform X1 n=1 Tax=Lytechinus pictus TaxID=7653 RepID=UPI0030B9F2FE